MANGSRGVSDPARISPGAKSGVKSEGRSRPGSLLRLFGAVTGGGKKRRPKRCPRSTQRVVSSRVRLLTTRSAARRPTPVDGSGHAHGGGTLLPRASSPPFATLSQENAATKGGEMFVVVWELDAFDAPSLISQRIPRDG
jgi:hypothetical protein